MESWNIAMKRGLMSGSTASLLSTVALTPKRLPALLALGWSRREALNVAWRRRRSLS